MTFDVQQRVSADKVTLQWQARGNDVKETRELARAGSSWAGTFFEMWGHDWESCAYTPAPTYVPDLAVGARQAIDSRCRTEGPALGGGTDTREVHVVGEVVVTGRRDVTVAGQPHRTFVVERHFKTFADGKEDETWITDLWSPEALAVVKHDVRVKSARGEAVIRTEMAGLQVSGG